MTPCRIPVTAAAAAGGSHDGFVPPITPVEPGRWRFLPATVDGWMTTHDMAKASLAWTPAVASRPSPALCAGPTGGGRPA